MKKSEYFIRYGEYTERQRINICNFIQSLVIDEKNEYEIVIKPYKLTKSLEQLGYYFSAIVLAAMEWQGLTQVEADMFLRQQLIEPIYKEVMSVTLEIRPSIAKMRLNEMSDYINKCVDFLCSHGVYVSPPRYSWDQ